MHQIFLQPETPPQGPHPAVLPLGLLGMEIEWQQRMHQVFCNSLQRGSQQTLLLRQTTVLRRTGEDMPWGLIWQQAPFLRGVRIVEKLEEGSAAACWNRQQEQCGLPDRCILPFDPFVYVKLAGHVAVCEIQRMLIRDEPVVQHG